MSRVLLDAGALIALDRNDVAMWRILAEARDGGVALVTHGGVIGQAWRGTRQARLAVALRAIDTRPLDGVLGRAAGALLAASKTNDVVEAALVLLAGVGDRIYTSDPEDVAHLAELAGLEVEIVGV